MPALLDTIGEPCHRLTPAGVVQVHSGAGVDTTAAQAATSQAVTLLQIGLDVGLLGPGRMQARVYATDTLPTGVVIMAGNTCLRETGLISVVHDIAPRKCTAVDNVQPGGCSVKGKGFVVSHGNLVGLGPRMNG
ncbi:hypothetical protein ASF66_05565 [Pseudomonas sp. Leaf129]|nr:hypothetical protein ASF66_05565 [Pseudomonas sp. Leaf129]